MILNRYKSHDHLQMTCTLWYKNVFCKDNEFDKRRLRLMYNNPANGRMAAIMKSLGLERGTADQLFLSPSGLLVWFEFKWGSDTQREAQSEFEKIVTEMGCEYYVIEQEEQFQNIIKRHFYGQRSSEAY